MFCLAKQEEQNVNLEIFGKDDTDDYQRLELLYLPCREDKANRKCVNSLEDKIRYLGPVDLLVMYN